MALRNCYDVTASEGGCDGTCPNGDTFNNLPPTQIETGMAGAAGYHDCCRGHRTITCGVYGGSNELIGLTMGGSGTIVRPTKPTLTGQPVKWRRQSGKTEEGTILGLTTTQLLIAGAVGVGAYMLMKKKK